MMTTIIFRHIRCASQCLVKGIQRPISVILPSDRSIHTTSQSGIKNYYDILGVGRNATPKEIKAAYYDKAKLLHPDANSHSDKATASKFQDVSEAYEVLGDTDKRRAYDSTTRPMSYDVYGRRTARDEAYKTPRRGPSQPVTMNHIQHVYRTLNRADIQEEKPKFRPFEDHNYPGTAFNRFEYSRVWDSNKNVFIYVKKATAGQYNREMMEKGRVLQLCVFVFLAGTGGCMLFINYMRSPYRPRQPPKPELTQEEKIMYILEGRRSAT